MSDPDPAACLLAGILALWGVAMSPFERWAYRAGAGVSRKFLAYAVTILSLWTCTAVAVRLYGWSPLLISPAPMTAWLPIPRLLAPALVVVLAAFCLLALLPLVQSLRGLRWRRAYQVAIRRDFARIPGFIPDTAAERAVWVVISLTAGLCEEVMYRGFLIRFLHEGTFGLPVAGALAVSCLCFGLGHVYQGLKGAANTTIAGFGFGVLFLLGGSLVPGMVLHALIDLQMVYVMRPIPGDAASTAAEMDVTPLRT
ncbi:MAG TPA: CPBP family intramembrane glutamic endopeptidase [Allosphingosinicella sp.]|nr:CPBP family intramembrane glutamic endopeptidase [Allosphingosinicella sp.]